MDYNMPNDTSFPRSRQASCIDLDRYRLALTAREILERRDVSVNGTGKIPCIARDEKTPSMHVYEHHAHCFGCGAHLDGIALAHWARTEQIDPAPRGPEFWETLRWIAREAELPEPRRDPDAEARYREAQDRSAYFERVFEDARKRRDKALEYLRGRGISAEAVGDDIGYSPKDYEPQDRETAKRYGLLSKTGRFLFSGYVVFPFPAAGRIETFYGRFLGDTAPEFKHRKPAGPQPVSLWNLDCVRRDKLVLVCESPIKALAVKANINTNVVALAGVAFKDEHARLLRLRGVQDVAILFDTDLNGAGQQAAVRAAELLYRHGYHDVVILTLPLPEGRDKNDVDGYFLAASAEDFRSQVTVKHLLEVIDDEMQTRSKDGDFGGFTEALNRFLGLIALCDPAGDGEVLRAIKRTFPNQSITDLKGKLKKFRRQHDNGGLPSAPGSNSDRFRPLDYVEQIRSETRVITFDSMAYRYEGGVYVPWPPEEIDQRVIQLYGPAVEPRHTRSVRELLNSVCFVGSDTVNPRGWSNLKNGLLNLHAGDFIDHTPDMLFTVQAQVRFDPEAQCPLWTRTLQEILPDPELRQLLSQIFGYCLTTDTSHQKGFILWGDGANGKSVMTDVLEALVGRDNAAALHLSDFQERFRLAELQNKLINFSTEVEAKGLVSDARIKSIVSGDPLTAERKNKQPFVFRPYCKLVISCNHLPQTTDRSHGYFRRWIVLPFTQTFAGNTQDRSRARTIIEMELSGVLNWAIGGYRDLRESREFSEPQASVDALQKYRRQVNPVLDFVNERIVFVDGQSTPPKDIFQAYRGWSEESGVKALGRNRFYEELGRADARLSITRTGEEGKVVKGVTLRPR